MILTLDFETHPITPADPWPKPVGCAVQYGSRPGKYLAWDHPGAGNNCAPEEARGLLMEMVRGADKVVFFNAPFDVGVARRMNVDVPWSKVEDVQILAFLADPYAKKRGLKDFAHLELGHAPAERDELYDWIRKNVPDAKGKSRKKLGEFISCAPGDLVGKYARGDVSRTYKLWRHWARFRGRAFEREMKLLPVLEDMTGRGIPLDGDALRYELPDWRAMLEDAEIRIHKIIGRGVDLDSHEQVADALEKHDLVKEWVETKKGARSLAYESMAMLVAEGNFDASFAELWGYRSVMKHTLAAFAEPWAAAGATLHPQWNSVKKERGASGARTFGAVTGRLSSTPNVQNIIKRAPDFVGRPPVPMLRRFVRAPEGYKLVGVDVSQQELRILAHLVGGKLAEWYRENPRLDLHSKVADEVRRLTGLTITREDAKTVNLATVYKNGIASMAAKIGCSYEDARRVKHAHAVALPGIKAWEKTLAARDTFETVGGRTYHHDLARPYKSGNTVIQGSAADQLKEIMIEAAPMLDTFGARLVLTAHDEIVALTPEGCEKRVQIAMADLVRSTGDDGTNGGAGAMFDVPMLADGYVRERWQE